MSNSSSRGHRDIIDFVSENASCQNLLSNARITELFCIYYIFFY